MNHEEFLKLVIDFGDACFDCGEWQGDKDTDMPYETLFATQQAAKEALLDAFRAVSHQGAEKTCHEF